MKFHNDHMLAQKGTFLLLDLKADIDGANLILKGSALHNLGAATEKARSPSAGRYTGSYRIPVFIFLTILIF